MNISEHITYKEATATSTGLKNDPGPLELASMIALAEVIFEPLRAIVGGPIPVTSFYRSPAVNKAKDGTRTSQHLKGQAMDMNMNRIKGSKVSNADLFNHLRKMNFDQLIWEFGDLVQPAWVHVSYNDRGVQRGQILRAVTMMGKTAYLPYV